MKIQTYDYQVKTTKPLSSRTSNILSKVGKVCWIIGLLGIYLVFFLSGYCVIFIANELIAGILFFYLTANRILIFSS